MDNFDRDFQKMAKEVGEMQKKAAGSMFKGMAGMWVIALIANLAFLGLAVFVVVKVLQWTGVL